MKSPINNKKELREVCKRNDIVFMAIFGSVARGDYKKDSDIDLLVHFSKPKSLLEIVRIERTISEVLGRKADLLTEASISPYLRDRIKQQMKVFYGRA
jgi:predicted nucleotidyltransferase